MKPFKIGKSSLTWLEVSNKNNIYNIPTYNNRIFNCC
jgi:hypothetical protein